MKTITGKRAFSLAEHYKPIIETQVKSVFDIPTEINFGNLEQLPDIAAYFSVKTDEKYYYILYCYYHYWDYTNFLLAKPFDEHRHDFEGALFRIPYFLPHHEKTIPIDVITVFHKELLYNEIEWLSPNTFDLIPMNVLYIQSEGHGIKYESKFNYHKNHLIVDNYKLISLNNFTKTQWETYKKIFNKNHVNMPDQWSDNGKYSGWMWKFPDKLFETKERVNNCKL